MLASRLQGIPPTIFSQMSALAVRTGSVNLGQGFPDHSTAGAQARPADVAHAPRPRSAKRT